MTSKSYRAAAEEVSRRWMSQHEIPFKMDRLRAAHKANKLACKITIEDEPDEDGGHLLVMGLHVFGEKAVHVAAYLFEGQKRGLVEASYAPTNTHKFNYHHSGLSRELIGRLVHASRYIGCEYLTTGQVEETTVHGLKNLGFSLVKRKTNGDIPSMLNKGLSLEQLRAQRSISELDKGLYSADGTGVVALADYSTPLARQALYARLGLPQPG